ncbi:MAG: hypothetical protein IPF93_22210 [Saprospiraceae bacterium]|nr:hypothetical protein [Saprospiraceae bacterium]
MTTSGLDDNSGALDINSNLTADFGLTTTQYGNQLFCRCKQWGKWIWENRRSMGQSDLDY